MRSDRYKNEKQAKHGKPAEKRKNRALKVILILIMLLALSIAGLITYMYKTAYDSIALTFTEDSPALDFGGSYPASLYVKAAEGNVSPESEALDTSSVGSHKLVYTVDKPLLGGLLDPSKEFVLSYTVTDSVAPVILWAGDGTVLQTGTVFDINKVISYGDNADPAPEADISGEVDTGTEGRYPLHITVTDASGNSAECDLTVEVASEIPSNEDDSERTSFAEFTEEHAGEGSSFGIDVSEWQKDIDFEAVKAAGCEFVMIRIGYGSGQDNISVDDTFDQNFERARAAGLRTGVYFYSYDNDVEGVRKTADWIMEKLGDQSPGLPVAFDWEDFSAFQTYNMSFYELNMLYDCFADELASGGYDCILYGSKNVLEKIWTDTGTRPVWLAHYTDATDYEGPYKIWQASNKGRIDGIEGDVDIDIMY